MEQNFKEKFNKLFEHLATEQQVTDDNIRSLMFGDYMAGKDEQKSYDEVQDLDTLREVMETIKLQTYSALLSSALSLFT